MGDPRHRPLCTSTGPLTKCRHPSACSIITAMKHQGQPYKNLDPVHRRPTWDTEIQKLHKDGDFFRKPRTTHANPNFIRLLSSPLFHQPSYFTQPAHHTSPACAYEEQEWRKWAGACERANLTFVRCSPPSSYDLPLFVRRSRSPPPREASIQSPQTFGLSHDLCDCPIFGFSPPPGKCYRASGRF